MDEKHKKIDRDYEKMKSEVDAVNKIFDYIENNKEFETQIREEIIKAIANHPDSKAIFKMNNKSIKLKKELLDLYFKTLCEMRETVREFGETNDYIDSCDGTIEGQS